MKITFVYWIHLKEHDLTEGYIGVSSNPNRRKIVHFCTLKCQTHTNIHLQRAFNKYKNQLIFSIILIADESYCYDLELKLRPNINIGWNINIGGTKPPSALGKQNAKGSKGPIKQVISPDGKIFESRKTAAIFYNVHVSTIINWIKNPAKPWIYKIHSTDKPIWNKGKKLIYGTKIKTPDGIFNSIRITAKHYNVVHGTINYWLNTKPELFSRIT